MKENVCDLYLGSELSQHFIILFACNENPRQDNWSSGSKLTPGPFNYEARVLVAVPGL
jgi:hypothetical protein